MEQRNADWTACTDAARAAGFDAAVPLDCATLRFLPEVRDMCAAGRCQKYGCCWTCPPGCGSVEECAQRAARFTCGIIVQTIGQLEDSYDIEGIEAAQERHKKQFAAFCDTLRADYPDLLALGAGGCTLCETCAYPEPCRFPDRALSSMEAYGLWVSEVCEKNSIPYYYGPGTIAFVGCYLLD